MFKQKEQIQKMVLSALLLAIGLVLPFLTGQIPEIGSALLPMHIPVLICGFICGWQWGLIVGLIMPLLRFLLFGFPPIYPNGIAMTFELATYGAVSGLLYSFFKKKTIGIYISLITAMLVGRVVWGMVRVVLLGFSDTEVFTWAIFVADAFINAIPGIVLQIVLIPLLIMSINKITSYEKEFQ